MTAIRYVTEGQMARKTGMKAIGYAFPEEEEIWIQKGLPKDLEMEVREHEFEHISKGEEGPFVGALIGAGASILGGVLGSKSSSKAAKEQAKASREAIAFERESRDLALGYQKPYRDASYRATAALMDLTGLSRGERSVAPAESPQFDWQGYISAGGSLMDKFGRAVEYGRNKQMPRATDVASDVPNLADFDRYEFTADPGYRFRLDEGTRALERGAAARGGLLSGGFARKALRYAQDYASNEYQRVYDRIATIAGFGSSASSSGANIIMGAAGNVGNALTNAGEARASGYVAQGNAWANAINQIGQLDWDSVFNKPKAQWV